MDSWDQRVNKDPDDARYSIDREKRYNFTQPAEKFSECVASTG